MASRRIAVGLAGYAPCFMPNHGHPALIPGACGLDGPARCAALLRIGWPSIPAARCLALLEGRRTDCA